MIIAVAAPVVTGAADLSGGRFEPHGPAGPPSGRQSDGAGLLMLGSAMRLVARVPHHTTRPWIYPLMPKSMKRKLDDAFDIAVARVLDEPECAGLFSALGSDGVHMLESSLYFVAGPYKETEVCRTAVAFAYVGDAPVKLCRRFSYLSDNQAAMILIHEALHHAGLPEHPQDPNALPGWAINRLVQSTCGF
jgi:hypothetical protein